MQDFSLHVQLISYIDIVQSLELFKVNFMPKIFRVTLTVINTRQGL